MTVSRPLGGVLSSASRRLGDHPSVRSTWGCRLAAAAGPAVPLFDLAPGGVYRAARVTPGAGALLPHRFTLACGRPVAGTAHRRSVLCGTFLRVTPTGISPAPCPAEPRPSSTPSPVARVDAAATRPAHRRFPVSQVGTGVTRSSSG